MIYELAIVANADANESLQNSLVAMVKEVVAENEGTVLVEDAWGLKTFAQPALDGTKKGYYMYFMYKAGPNANLEIARRLKINEGVQRHMVVKLGEDRFQEQLVKEYKTPLSKKHHGSVTDEDENREDKKLDKEKRRFTKRKGCWFTIRNISADWKDPLTYGWLVNEFGKISPARISGISRKHQRFANTAIKRARNLGISSHLSNRIAE